MFKKIVTFIAISLLAACANGPIKPDLSKELKASNIAVVYYMNKKSIKYSEDVYKVLWIQRESQNASFESIWDIDRDMSTRFAVLLAGQGLMAAPLQDVLRNAPDGYAAFQKSMRNDEGWSVDHPRKPITLDEKTIAALNKANIQYVIFDQYNEFQVDANMFAGAIGKTLAVLSVYDVGQKKEIYMELHTPSGIIKVDSPKEIEANGLAKLKGATYEWLEKSLPFYVDRLQISSN